MYKLKAEAQAKQLAMEILKTNPTAITGTASGEESAKRVADCIKYLASRLEKDLE